MNLSELHHRRTTPKIITPESRIVEIIARFFLSFSRDDLI